MEEFQCEVDLPSLDEVCTAIRQLRNNRAPGEDGTPAEIYKTCLESVGPWLHRIISKVRTSNCGEAFHRPLFKKVDM